MVGPEMARREILLPDRWQKRGFGFTTVSLSMPVFTGVDRDDCTVELVDMIPDRKDPIEAWIEAEDRRAMIKAAVQDGGGKNSARDSEIVMRNMNGETMHKIAGDYGLTYQRVQQIVEKERKNMQTRILKSVKGDGLTAYGFSAERQGV